MRETKRARRMNRAASDLERSGARMMTEELQTITVTLEIEPAALALLQQQADQQGLTWTSLRRAPSGVLPPRPRRRPAISGPPTLSTGWWLGTSRGGQRQRQDVRACERSNRRRGSSAQG